MGGVIMICHTDSYERSCFSFRRDINFWEHRTSLRSAARFSGSTIIHGALLLTGGHNGYDVTSRTQIVTDGRVVTGPNLLGPRYHHCVVNLHDGRFLVVGGKSHYYDPGLLTSEFHDLKTGSSHYGPPLISVRIDPACVHFHSPLHNNRTVVLIFGKYKDSGSQFKVQVIDFTQPLATWNWCK